ncbi:putative inhibitor of apoptosis [Histomonas meleagridis]|uniref:putative inhibitor of apoptosis n=1 Tax=Histomonas meleagridis TaxID=135588 RepID=UPI003559F8CF|nr:putative inhibitor of apoptosis [Histomonas meleagridis]KAH0801294.1 putative inhibitor of apoptosis [Histomonas meleagridis]
MGNTQSGEQDDKKIRSKSSYFGDNGSFGEMDHREIKSAVKQLQAQRMQSMDPGYGTYQPPQSTQLKTAISVGRPDPYILNVNGIDFLSFGIKTEASCKIVVTANGNINSFRIPASDRIVYSIPIPAYTSFDLEITPEAGEIQPSTGGFTNVLKHILKFKLLSDEGEMYFNFDQQQLLTSNEVFTIAVGKRCRMENSNETEKCCICRTNDASIAIAPCGHKVLCDDCLEVKQAKLHHCPYCNSLSSF